MSEAEPTTTAPMSPRRAASRIRVTVFVNGGEPPGGRLLTFEPAFTTWEELLKAAGAKLGATRPFTRVFVENGAEADSVGDIFSGDQLYFSHGEDFRKAEEAKSTVVPLPVGTDGSINSSAEDEKHQFVTSLATSVASAATTLYESSSQYVKGKSPGFVKVTLETVETRVGPYANPLLTKLLEYTSWADEKLDGVYNRLQKRNKAFQASPLAQTVNDNLVIPFKEFVVEPSSAFFNAASDKYRQLDINRDGKVAVDSFVAGLKQQLGSAWNDKLIEPAKAFHAAASTQIANNKTIQDAKDLLDKTWKDVVVANFKAKITAPAEAFYQMALSNFMALRAASGNGAVSFQDFVAGLRSSFGRLWSERLVPPAQHLYDQFTAAAEKATNAILGPEDEDEDDSEYVPQYREVKRKE